MLGYISDIRINVIELDERAFFAYLSPKADCKFNIVRTGDGILVIDGSIGQVEVVIFNLDDAHVSDFFSRDCAFQNFRTSALVGVLYDCMETLSTKVEAITLIVLAIEAK